MTIARKLLIAGALLVGMQQIALPHTSQVACEVSQMLNFAQALHQVNHKDALKVAQWLEIQACDMSNNVQDYDIMAIANVINNPELTIQSKISVLSQTITTQRNKNIKDTIGAICGTVITATLFVGFASLMTTMAIEESKRPRRTVTVTISRKNPYPWDNHYQLNPWDNHYWLNPWL